MSYARCSIAARSAKQTPSFAAIGPSSWTSSRRVRTSRSTSLHGRDWIAEGAAKAGRDPNEIATSPFTTVIPIPGKGASSKAREIISFYIGGMGEYYKQLLSGFGYEDECNEIERLYSNKATRKMAPDAVTDDMIEVLTISGDPLYCRREIARRRELGMEQPIINLPPGMPWPGIAAFIT
ncbi:MAG: LLM class flavin-dependent oxidoreductase, partial [Deltaproteobacteria bacterium]|nr:LLM class flavin-dependent oxidoreductase [Deltaproteobacteria bacterium]